MCPGNKDTRVERGGQAGLGRIFDSFPALSWAYIVFLLLAHELMRFTLTSLGVHIK